MVSSGTCGISETITLLALQAAPLVPTEALLAATMEALPVPAATTRLPLPAPLLEAPPVELAARPQATMATTAPHPLPTAPTTAATVATTATGAAQRYVKVQCAVMFGISCPMTLPCGPEKGALMKACLSGLCLCLLQIESVFIMTVRMAYL